MAEFQTTPLPPENTQEALKKEYDMCHPHNIKED